MFQRLKSFHLFVIKYLFKIFNIFRMSYKEALQAGVYLNLNWVRIHSPNTRISSHSSLFMQSMCQIVNFKFIGW